MRRRPTTTSQVNTRRAATVTETTRRRLASHQPEKSNPKIKSARVRAVIEHWTWALSPHKPNRRIANGKRSKEEKRKKGTQLVFALFAAVIWCIFTHRGRPSKAGPQNVKRNQHLLFLLFSLLHPHTHARAQAQSLVCLCTLSVFHCKPAILKYPPSPPTRLGASPNLNATSYLRQMIWATFTHISFRSIVVSWTTNEEEEDEETRTLSTPTPIGRDVMMMLVIPFVRQIFTRSN